MHLPPLEPPNTPPPPKKNWMVSKYYMEPFLKRPCHSMNDIQSANRKKKTPKKQIYRTVNSKIRTNSSNNKPVSSACKGSRCNRTRLENLSSQPVQHQQTWQLHYKNICSSDPTNSSPQVHPSHCQPTQDHRKATRPHPTSLTPPGGSDLLTSDPQ